MADRSHPYRRTRTQYSLEILHVPLDYDLDGLEEYIKQKWGYCIDNFRTIEDDQHPTYIFYINFSNKDVALECEDYLVDSERMTPRMRIKERVRDVSENTPSMGTGMGMGMGTGKERRTRGRGRGRSRGRGARTMFQDEYHGPDYDLGRAEPPHVDNIHFSTLPYSQEFNLPFPSKQEEYNAPFPPKPVTKTFTPERENTPHTPKFERVLPPKREKSEAIIHIGNIPSFVDKPILNDLLLSKQIEGVNDTKIREDPTDPSVNEALVYLDDETAMEDIISKLNHVKVASKPFKAKQRKKETRKEIDPQEYISSELPRYDKNEQLPFPPPPSQNINQVPRRVSQSEDLA